MSGSAFIQTVCLLAGAAVLARLVWWDLRTLVLPDGLVAAFAGVGAVLFLLAPLPGQTPVEALAGAAVYGTVFWSLRAVMSHAIGAEAMGLGDVKLVAAIGLWLGWAALPLFMLVSAALTILVRMMPAVWAKAVEREGEMPFGPGLCAGAAVLIALRAAGAPVGWMDPAVLGPLLG